MECDCIGAVFYVPNCSNMQYLGSFSPSELLCPVTHVWVPLEQCRPLLRESLFCRFAPRVDGGEQLREWEDDPTSDATPEEAQAVSNAIIHHRSMFYFLSVRVIALAHGLHCVVATWLRSNRSCSLRCAGIRDVCASRTTTAAEPHQVVQAHKHRLYRPDALHRRPLTVAL